MTSCLLSWMTKSFQTGGLLLKKRICSSESKFFPFRVYPPSRRKTKDETGTAASPIVTCMYLKWRKNPVLTIISDRLTTAIYLLSAEAVLALASFPEESDLAAARGPFNWPFLF